MKSMMKKTLSVIIALAMILVPMSVFAAELGEYDNPYQLTTTSGPRFSVSVAPGAYVYVQVDNSDGSTVSVDYATNSNYEIYYLRQTYYAETESGNNTTSFAMVADVNMFTVYNPSETDYVVLYPSLTAGTPADTTGTMDDPKEVTLAANMFGGVGANEEVTLEAGNQGYWFTCTAPSDGILTVAVNALDADYNYIGWMYNVNNSTKGIYGDNHWSDEEVPVYYEELEVSEGDEIVVFASTYDPASWTNPAGTVAVEFTFDGVGSAYYPEVLDATGSYSADITAGSWGYYYTWTATEEGTVTVAMDDASGWQYSVNVEPAAEDGNWYYGDMHWSDDEPVVASESVEVAAGDIVSVNVCTYDPASWQVPAGTVNWTLSFEAGATGDDGETGDDGDDSGDIGGSTGDEEELNYAVSDTLLDVGSNDYAADMMYQYTVYTLAPTETGKYTITVDDGSVIGIVSYTDMWVQSAPSADNVASTSVEWECTDVGQAIMVAVMADDNAVSLTITKEELDTSDEVQWTIYENTVTPEAFEYEGDVNALIPVDFEDDIIDDAVLGEDGYYHLNSADGPILYANLNETALQSLVSIIGNSKLSAIHYGENGEVIEKIDYTEAVTEYINSAYVDEATGAYYYPLTADLIEMFKEVGASNQWYDGEIWVHDSADAWMFACYYAPVVEDGGDNNTGNVADPEIPNTDNEVFAWAMAMMFATAAAGATIVLRKTKRVK